MTARRPQAGSPEVSLDLDALEREGGTPEPFTVHLAGERIMFSDPKDLDWQALLDDMGDPRRFFRLVVPPDSHETFFSAYLPTWKMDVLMSAYLQHYGLPSPGNASASPVS